MAGVLDGIINATGMDDTALMERIAGITQGQHQQQWSTYYAPCNFPTTRAGAGPFTYTIAQGIINRVFTTHVGGPLTGVGFPAGTLATLADTNLTTDSQTNNGEFVVIYGIAIQPYPDTNGAGAIGADPALVKAADQQISVTMTLGAGTLWTLGNPSMCPGGGGLFGLGDSYILNPDANSYVYKTGVLTHGMPLWDNFRFFTDPLIWAPSGKVDSVLNVTMTCERAVNVVNLDANRAGTASGATTQQTPLFAAPAATAVNLPYKVTLYSKQVNARSSNA